MQTWHKKSLFKTRKALFPLEKKTIPREDALGDHKITFKVQNLQFGS